MVLDLSSFMGQTSTNDGQFIAWFGREFFGVFSRNGECQRVSENIEQVVGYTPQQCEGPGFKQHIRKIDIKKFQQLLSKPDSNKDLRIRIKNPQGHWEWLEAGHATKQRDGTVAVIFHKITQEVSKESALQKATMETELAMRGQSEFFAHISHELRTPLNAILGFSEMMHQGMFGEVNNPRYRDYIAFLQQSGQELLHKIDDLLEISSFCAGVDALVEKNVPLQDIIKTAINAHARDLFARHIQVNVQVQDVLLVADRVKLQLACAHLIRNALKFSPQGGVITIESSVDKRGKLSLAIRDHGKGFSKAQLAYFSDSVEELSFHDRSLKVMGFGLPLADELIRLHGGQMSCRNCENGGAEVMISLPARRIISVKKEILANDEFRDITSEGEFDA